MKGDEQLSVVCLAVMAYDKWLNRST